MFTLFQSSFRSSEGGIFFIFYAGLVIISVRGGRDPVFVPAVENGCCDLQRFNSPEVFV